jgi:GTP cyclohydrolase III
LQPKKNLASNLQQQQQQQQQHVYRSRHQIAIAITSNMAIATLGLLPSLANP